VFEHLTAIDAASRLARAARETSSAGQLRRRLHTWFDGFRTLKFVHAFRSAGHPELPFREALARAAFIPDALGTIDDLLEALTRAEAGLPDELGPARL
jgi:hypothetical protein